MGQPEERNESLNDEQNDKEENDKIDETENDLDAAPRKKDKGALMLTLVMVGLLALVILAQVFAGH